MPAILGRRLKSINYTLLFLGCVLFHIAGTWSLPLIDRDEPRFAEASREMMERGDYIVPYFNNQFRFDKPPLTYWVQVVSYRIFGQNDFAARFPTTIAAALVALSIFAWGKRIGGDKAGWIVAIIFTLCLQTFIHAKAAVADMWLVLFVTTAHWAGYELLFGNGKRPTSNVQRPTPNSEYLRWWLVFYLSLALGFLAKGPIAWVPLLTVAATKFYLPNSQLLRRFKFLRGILLMLALISLWGVPALIRTHGEFFSVGIGRHVIGRSIGAMEGHGANSLGLYLLLLPFYFITVFASFFPWSIQLPSLARRLWKSRDDIDNYLLSGTAVIFIIFSLIKTKLPHYTLPAFPLLALLLARRWPAEKAKVFSCLGVATAGLWIALALIAPPFLASSFPARALFEQAHGDLRPEMEFGAIEYQEPSLVWYFRSRVHGFMTPLKKKTAAEFMERSGPRFVILPTASLSKTFAAPPSDWKTYSAQGFNVAKGKRVDLTLILKPQ